MILINGEQTNRLDCRNRGLQYGDGLFETIAVQDGRLLLWERHLRRLHAGCRRLAMPQPDREVLLREGMDVCRGTDRGVLKIIITRGMGGRGYGFATKIDPTRILALYPWPKYPIHNETSGVRVCLCVTRLGCNPALAGIKHLNRLEQVLGRGEWQSADIAEGLMLDGGGHVIEGTMSNVFLVRNGALLTPDLSTCGVQGIIRNLVLEIAGDLGIKHSVGTISVEEMKLADEVFITNSLIGLWPVREFDGSQYSAGCVTHVIAQKLRQVLC